MKERDRREFRSNAKFLKFSFERFRDKMLVDVPFCLGYFVQFLFLGPRAHLRQISSLGPRTSSVYLIFQVINLFLIICSC